MLRVPPVNLNKQSQDATIQLIRDVLRRGIQLSEVTHFPLQLGASRLNTHYLGVRRRTRKHHDLRGIFVLHLPRD